MELLSLEDPSYLLAVFALHPLSCLTLLRYIPFNTGGFAREHIRDPALLRFIDIECFIFSVVPAGSTPMINSGMVFCDRHYGGINYPRGGVASMAEALVEGLRERGSVVEFGARVTGVLMEGGEAVGVRMADGREIWGKAVVSNATRWDTFGEKGLVPPEETPELEKRFLKNYVKTPSFVSVHLGVRADAIPADTVVHHVFLEDWKKMECSQDAEGVIFLSIPTVLDPSLAPAGQHIFHVFTPSFIDEWQGLNAAEYAAKKAAFASRLIARLETRFPGLGAAVSFQEVGTPRTHRRYLGRRDGTYGPMPWRPAAGGGTGGAPGDTPLAGLLAMPFNRTAVRGLYCVGDSAFPGQGLNAVAFSGFACGRRVAVDVGVEKRGVPKGVDDALSDVLGVKRLEWFSRN